MWVAYFPTVLKLDLNDLEDCWFFNFQGKKQHWMTITSYEIKIIISS